MGRSSAYYHYSTTSLELSIWSSFLSPQSRFIDEADIGAADTGESIFLGETSWTQFCEDDFMETPSIVIVAEIFWYELYHVLPLS